MNYKVIESETLYSLESKVSRLMKDGWTPIGGVSLGNEHGKYIVSSSYIQAMVKSE